MPKCQHIPIQLVRPWMFLSNIITGHKLEAQLLYRVASVALVGLNIGSCNSFRESSCQYKICMSPNIPAKIRW